MDRQIRTICVAADIGGASSVNFRLNVDFPVRKVECHAILLEDVNNSKNNIVSIVQTNLIPHGGVIASTFDTKTVNQFTNPLYINGVYQFTFLKADGTLDTTANKEVFLNLIFFE